MPNPVVVGGTATCSMGAGIFNLSAVGNIMFENKPILTEKDCVFGANVIPSGVMCSSASNPTVAAANGAPQPCSAMFTGQWMPCTFLCKVKNMGVVDSSCSLMCSYGGKISIANAGVVKSSVK